MEHLQGFPIKLDNLVLVRDVYENFSLAVNYGSFRLAFEGNGACNGTVRGIDGSHIVACAVHDENTLGDVIVDKRVRVLTGFNSANLRQSLKIDDGRCIC